MVKDTGYYRVLLREVSLWLNGYCSALGDDAPFTSDHLVAFAAADGALMREMKAKEEALDEPIPSLYPS